MNIVKNNLHKTNNNKKQNARGKAKSISAHEKIKLIKSKIKQGKNRSDLFTVNSISGGRTSAYMAVHNLADLNIFSIVHTDDPRYHFKDHAIRKYVWDKCGTDLIYGTLEHDNTIKSVMELEQFIGQEIFMVYGDSFDKVINDRKFLPNQVARFCTYEMKLKPIFEFLTLSGLTQYHNLYNPTYEKLTEYIQSADLTQPFIRMNIGYRISDIERIVDFTEHFKHVVGIHESGRHKGQRKWKTTHWRIGNFPVIQKPQSEIIHFWKNKNVTFPKLNNCEFCFNRSIYELNRQFQEVPEKANWWLQQEILSGSTFRKDYSLEQIKNMKFTEDLDFTASTMCSSGSCTD